jgi:hypothetical protein
MNNFLMINQTDNNRRHEYAVNLHLYHMMYMVICIDYSWIIEDVIWER